MINETRLAKYKNARRKGLSKTESMRQAGYNEITSTKHQHDTNVVKRGEDELASEFKSVGITAEDVLRELAYAQSLAKKLGKTSDFIRASELKGRFLAMFKDYQKTESIGEGEGDFDSMLRALGLRKANPDGKSDE